MQTKTHTTARLVTDIVLQQILWDYLPTIEDWTIWINNHCGESIRGLLHKVDRWEVANCIEDLIGDVKNIIPYLRSVGSVWDLDNMIAFPLNGIVVTVGEHLGDTVFESPEDWHITPKLRKDLIGVRCYAYQGNSRQAAIPVDLEAIKGWIIKED